MKIKNSSLKSFVHELFKNYFKEFSIITLLVVIDGFLLSLSVLSLIPLTDLFFNSGEFNKITIFIISIIKDINLPVNLLTFFLLFIVTTFLKSFFSIIINYQTQNLKYYIYSSLFKRLFSNVLSAKWIFSMI